MGGCRVMQNIGNEFFHRDEVVRDLEVCNEWRVICHHHYGQSSPSTQALKVLRGAQCSPTSVIEALTFLPSISTPDFNHQRWNRLAITPFH